MNTADNLIKMGNEIVAIGERMRSVISADPANAIEVGVANNPNQPTPVQNNGAGEVPATLSNHAQQQQQQQQQQPAQQPVVNMTAPSFFKTLGELYPVHGGEVINAAILSITGGKCTTAQEIQDDATRQAVIDKIKGVV